MALEYEPYPIGYDPDFAAGLISAVQVQIDLGATGTGAYSHGATRTNYQPVADLGAIPCQITAKIWKGDVSLDIMSGDRPAVESTHVVLWAHHLLVDRRYRLIGLDPVTLEPLDPPMIYAVTGGTENERQMNHHYRTRCRREVL